MATKAMGTPASSGQTKPATSVRPSSSRRRKGDLGESNSLHAQTTVLTTLTLRGLTVRTTKQ